MTETNTTTITKDAKNENNQKLTDQENLDDFKIIKELKNINIDSEKLPSLTKALDNFKCKLKSLNNVGNILTNEVFKIFDKLIKKDRIKINLILSRIYLGIISNNSLYNNYLMFEKDDSNRIDCLIRLISDCSSIIEKLEGFVFDPELFKFKNKTMDLLKCIYFNCKNKINNDEKIRKLEELIDTLPPKFYSNAFIELNKNKDLYDIFKSQTLDKIASFEDKFLQVNNYFEQFEVFRKFVENNSGSIKCTSINDENIGKNKEEDNKETVADPEKAYFYQNYALLLLKFCKYHNYVFLNREELKEDKIVDDENTDGDNDNDNENARVVFLLDKFKEEKKDENQINETKEENKKNKKIEEILQDNYYHSVIDSKEYIDLIKKEVNYYLQYTKNLDNDEKLKSLRKQMNYFISTLGKESYVPLLLRHLSKITISDNFTPSFVTNVPAGKVNKLYLETKTNENMLIYIEFFLEDKSKDITIEINKYDENTNSFKQMYKEEKAEDMYKFFILCKEYSLYQIVFNNDYSWFNSKEVFYRISLLNLSEKQNQNIETKEDELCVNLKGNKIIINVPKIDDKIKYNEKERTINIPVILYLNNLRIGSFQKKEDKDELIFKEIFEEDEKIVPKKLFDYQIEKYLKKEIKDKEKRIIISIFSQNRNLVNNSKELEEKIKSCEDKKEKEYLQKIGFIPNFSLEEYKVDYKLYDLCEQNLIYHLYLSGKEKKSLEKPLLFLKFDKFVVNYAILSEGNIFTEIQRGINGNLEKNNNENYAINIIDKVKDEFSGVDIVLSYIDINSEEEKNKLMETFEKIKKLCQEMDSTSQVVVYNNNDINLNIFKYINFFYDN